MFSKPTDSLLRIVAPAPFCAKSYIAGNFRVLCLVEVCMERLREFKLTMVGANDAPATPISLLAATPIIALFQGATLAIGYGAKDFSVCPGKRAFGSYR